MCSPRLHLCHTKSTSHCTPACCASHTTLRVPPPRVAHVPRLHGRSPSPHARAQAVHRSVPRGARATSPLHPNRVVLTARNPNLSVLLARPLHILSSRTWFQTPAAAVPRNACTHTNIRHAFSRPGYERPGGTQASPLLLFQIRP
jgi:hypothetical protein